MKTVLIVISALMASASAHAQLNGQPFRLEAGRYASECWFANVVKTENGEYRRTNGYEKGTFTSVIQGDVALEIVQSQGTSRNTRSVTKVITTPLGDGLFKQTSEIEVTDSLGKFVSTARMKYETNMRVDQNLTQNIMVRYGEERERPAFGESVWRKMSDGRIIVQSYLRDKTAMTTLVSGQQKNDEKLVANNLCIYTPQP